MPRLSLINNLSSPKCTRIQIMNEPFNTTVTTDDWTDDAGAVASFQSGGYLKLIHAENGYSSISLPVIANQSYKYTINCAATIASGDSGPIIKFGTSANNNSIANIPVAESSSPIIKTGTIDVGAITTLYLTLFHDTNVAEAYWDEIIIEDA